MATEMVHIGFKNFLAINRVIAISSPNSAPGKRSVQEARVNKNLIDLTNGRKAKAVILVDNGVLVLASVEPGTIVSRASTGQQE